MRRTKGPWKWLSNVMLVGNHGARPVVIGVNPRGQLVHCNEEGQLRPIDLHHPDMKALAGAGRLVSAVEAFLKLRTSIFPGVRGAAECSALEELEHALKASGGRVPYDPEGSEAVKEWIKRGMELEKEVPFPGTNGRRRKK